MNQHILNRRGFLGMAGSAGAALAAGGLLAACGSGSSGTSASTNSTIQLLQYNDADYNSLYGEGFAAAAKQLGVDSRLSNGHNDPDAQVKAYNQALVAGIAGAAICPVDGLNIESLVASAEQRGTDLVGSWGVSAWYTPWGVSDRYTYLTPDVYVGVKAVTEVLAKTLDGKGKVVRVRGTNGNGSDLQISAATDSVLANYPGIELVGELYSEWTPESAQKSAAALLTRFPDAAAVIANDDAISTGVVAAINALGKKPGEDILVVGNNGSNEAVQRIADGTQLATDGTVPTLLGYHAAVRLFDLANGWKPEVGERALSWAPITLTKDTVQGYLDRYVHLPADRHFDARLMSRTVDTSSWDPQVPLYVLDPEHQWAGSDKPSGWTVPAEYKTGRVDGSFEALESKYAAAARIGLLDASPVN